MTEYKPHRFVMESIHTRVVQAVEITIPPGTHITVCQTGQIREQPSRIRRIQFIRQSERFFKDVDGLGMGSRTGNRERRRKGQLGFILSRQSLIGHVCGSIAAGKKQLDACQIKITVVNRGIQMTITQFSSQSRPTDFNLHCVSFGTFGIRIRIAKNQCSEGRPAQLSDGDRIAADIAENRLMSIIAPDHERYCVVPFTTGAGLARGCYDLEVPGKKPHACIGCKWQEQGKTEDGCNLQKNPHKTSLKMVS